jgi:hypothetical protein
MESDKVSKSNVPMACASLKERAAVIHFYLANSHFAKKDLIGVIIEALFQLELLGYPSITKRVESLVYGLSRDQKGKNGAISDQNGAWGTSPLKNAEYVNAQRKLNQYSHELIFHPCDAVAEDS